MADILALVGWIPCRALKSADLPNKNTVFADPATSKTLQKKCFAMSPYWNKMGGFLLDHEKLRVQQRLSLWRAWSTTLVERWRVAHKTTWSSFPQG